MITNIGQVEQNLLKPASTTSLKDSPLPGFIPGKAKDSAQQYRVRYQNICVRDPADLAELEKIETKAWRGEDVYVLDKKNYVFMDQMWILVQYLEKVPA